MKLQKERRKMIYKTVGELANQRLRNLENERYIKRILKKEKVDKIEDLPQAMQISIEREAAYLKGLFDGIRLSLEIKNQCPRKQTLINGKDAGRDLPTASF